MAGARGWSGQSKMALRLADKVTIYTNGNDNSVKELEALIYAEKVSIDNREIARLEPGSGRGEVVLHFKDGSSATEGFLVRLFVLSLELPNIAVKLTSAFRSRTTPTARSAAPSTRISASSLATTPPRSRSTRWASPTSRASLPAATTQRRTEPPRRPSTRAAWPASWPTLSSSGSCTLRRLLRKRLLLRLHLRRLRRRPSKASPVHSKILNIHDCECVNWFLPLCIYSRNSGCCGGHCLGRSQGKPSAQPHRAALAICLSTCNTKSTPTTKWILANSPSAKKRKPCKFGYQPVSDYRPRLRPPLPPTQGRRPAGTNTK